ncbi:hypothetical protein WJX74_001870 [Apatococcus lobatus]|uniref:HIT domain-containing protein n=1 Tax=Apatococcus lobatus TaxID=904363 RepID=A0AAW1RZF2_9CHLO
MLQTGLPRPCPFCDIVQKRPGSTKTIWEDDTLLAFRDRTPAAKEHLLIIPKRHIPTVKSLTREDYQLVLSMGQVGESLIQECALGSGSKFGFHTPPFNSVDHLHLHCFALPHMPAWKGLKYMERPSFNFVPLGTVLERLKP